MSKLLALAFMLALAACPDEPPDGCRKVQTDRISTCLCSCVGNIGVPVPIYETRLVCE